MASELEKIIVTMEANNAALLKKIDQNTKSLKKFEGSTKRSLEAVDKSFAKTGRVASASGKKIGRSFKGAAGQLGFQVQDIAVQLQAGQNAMLIFGQQGSQIASIFGPGGAVIGALIAVTSALAGALVPKLFESKSAVDELDRAFKRLSETLDKNDSGIFEYTKQFKQLFKLDPDAAGVRVLANQNEALEASRVAVKALKDELGDISGLSNKFNIPIQDLGELTRILNKPIVGKEDLFKLQEILNRLALSGKAASPEFIKLADTVNASVLQIKNLDSQLEALSSKSYSFDSIGDASKIADQRVKAIKKSVAASSAELNDFIKQMEKLGRLDEAFKQRVSVALGQAFPEDARIGKLRGQILDLNVALEQAFSDGDTQKVKQYGAAIAELESQITAINNQPLKDALSQAFPDQARIAELEAKIGTLKTAVDNAIDSGDVEAADRYREAISKLNEQIDNMDPMKRKIKELGATLDDSLSDGIANAIAGVKDWEKQFLASIAKILIESIALKAIGPSGGNVGATILSSLFSFDGGGFTGTGPRAGGIDGKGGFPAILHPNETVLDHTRGESGGNNINITVQANEPSKFIKAQRRIAAEAALALDRLK